MLPAPVSRISCLTSERLMIPRTGNKFTRMSLIGKEALTHFLSKFLYLRELSDTSKEFKPSCVDLLTTDFWSLC